MDIALQAIDGLSANNLTDKSFDQGLNLASSQQWQADQNDISAFNQALESAQQTEVVKQPADIQASYNSYHNESSLSEDVLSKMQSLSDSAAQKGEELERLVSKATDTLNPMDVIQANRMMSEYYLENLMTAKLVGNASKAVERLTSLN